MAMMKVPKILTDLYDFLTSYAGSGGKYLRVNAGETGVEAVTLTAADIGADATGTAAAAISGHTTTIDHAPIAHSNRTALDAVSGVNTGDQTLPTTLPASDVSAWAKSATKPSYTAAEVSALALTGGTLTGAIVGNAATGAAAVKFAIKPDVNSTSALQIQKSDGTNILNIDATNNRVGIGVAAPEFQAHIRASSPYLRVDSSGISGRSTISTGQASVELRLRVSGTSAGGTEHGISLYGMTEVMALGSYGLLVGTDNDKPIVFIQSDAEKARFTSTGLGIGTLAPSEKLHVVGNAFIKSATDNATAFRVEKTAAATVVFAVDTSTDKAVATQYALSALNTAPASATATGVLGEIRVTAGAIYICTATNAWVKTALATW